MIHNELTIIGDEDGIDKLVKKNYIDGKWIFPHVQSKGVNTHSHKRKYLLYFYTEDIISKDWLSGLQKKYPYLGLSIYWSITNRKGNFGMINQQGDVLSIKDSKDLRLVTTVARKVLKWQPKNKETFITTNSYVLDGHVYEIKIAVSKISKGLYLEKHHHLLIAFNGDVSYCLGVYESRTGQTYPLTLQHMFVCEQYGIAHP